MRARRNLVGLAALALAMVLTGSIAVASPAKASSLLWDNNYSTTDRLTGTPSQDLTAVVEPVQDYDKYDSEAADDVKVPRKKTWSIERIDANGFYGSWPGMVTAPGPAPSFNVRVYANSGSLPGGELTAQRRLNVVATRDVAGAIELELTPAISLSTGSYWLSVQANVTPNVDGQWSWANTNNGAQKGYPAAWRQPGDGSGRGCVNWGARSTTCGLGGTGPDQMFRLYGTIS